MAFDDYLYFAILSSTVPLGFFLKLIKAKDFPNTVFYRKLFCILGGLLQIIIGTRTQAWHSLLLIFLNYVILRCLAKSRWCPRVSFVITFGYLLFFRTMHFYGFSPFTGPTNALQLLSTFRLVSLAFDAQEMDYECDLFTYLSYSFSFIGLFSGPFYHFRVFMDTINNPHLTNLSTLPYVKNHLMYVPFYVVFYLFLEKAFPSEYLLTSEFTNHPWGIIYRIFYIYLFLFGFKVRFYIGWELATSGAIAAGLGGYPTHTEPVNGFGPTKNKSERLAQPGNELDFLTVYQVRPWQVESTVVAKEGLRHWNMTCQYWLYFYVYKRFPWNKYRHLAVYIVGAFWHGIYPGYYVVFMSFPFYLIAQDQYFSLTTKLRVQQFAFFWKCMDWIYTHTIYSYIHVAFRYLTAGAIVTIYSSLYYSVHVVTLSLVLLRLVLPDTKRD